MRATPTEPPGKGSPSRPAASQVEARSTEATGKRGSESLLVQRFVLRVLSGPNVGMVHESTTDSVIVGTHASADLVLQDSSVSRFHCELTVTPEGLLVRDLGSMNGTTVDGVAVFHARLKSGSTLTLGRTALAVQLGGEPLEVPLSTREHFGLAVGKSPAMKRVFAVLERAAASDTTVLLEGETGTGKEVAAESIHRESARADGPFIVVDCGAIPRDLLESELFGHERGAFTGAVSAREGAFEAASGGTLFLDEIGELAEDLQPKLLRVLERKEVKRVGQNKHFKVDVRLVAATHRDLRAEVNAKRFRPDLYYRLAVLHLRLPPLRQRVEDIPMLVERILATVDGGDRPEAALLRQPSALADLAAHGWPGNVRELRNYVERCLTLAARAPFDEAAQGADAPLEIDARVPLRQAREGWVRHFERRYLEALLGRSNGNVSAAARAAGVERIHMYRLLWRHGMR